jgi:repressor LexA
MDKLTKKQAAILQFLKTEEDAGRPCPTHQEITEHFGYSSTNTAQCHIRALIKKGFLGMDEGKARSLRVLPAFPQLRRPIIAEIPLYGSIPAGFGEDREQQPDGCVAVDVSVIGFKPTARTFCLRVVGHSMIGKHICEGDIVVMEHGPEPRNGEVVAALIDGKTTLKTFVKKGNKRFLQAENPKFPNLIPSEELVIQGVFKALIRRA